MALALVVLALFDREQPGAMLAVAGGVLYVVGMFAVTMAVNVPLNDALAAADPSTRRARRGRVTCTTGRCGITCARWRRPPRACASSGIARARRASCGGRGLCGQPAFDERAAQEPALRINADGDTPKCRLNIAENALWLL